MKEKAKNGGIWSSQGGAGRSQRESLGDWFKLRPEVYREGD